MSIQPPSNGTVLESERAGDTRSRLLRTHNKRGISRTGFGFGVASAGNSAITATTGTANSSSTTATTAATPTTPASETTSQPPATRQGPVTRSTSNQPQQPLRLSPYHPQLHQSTSPEDDQTITRSRAAQYGPSSTEERIRRRRASLSSPQGSPVVEEKRKSVAADASVSRARSGRAPPSSWASREPERRPPSSSSNVSRPGSAAGKTTGERASVTRSASQSRDGGVPSRQKSVSRRNTSTTTAAASVAQPPKPSLSRSSSVTRQTRSTTANATPASRPPSRPPSISTRRDTEMKPPPSKTAFSTYQRAYSPTKRSTSTTTTPARQSSRVSAVNNPPSVKPSNAPSIDDVRQQAELLQLSILHAAAAPTARAWTSSAYKALSAKFSALGQQYDDISALERTARQHRNLVAMHNWTAGNTRSLTRKLILLQFVLEELCALTFPGDRPPGNNGYQPSALSNCGRYTYIVIQFSTWAAWVKSIWSQRDLEEALATKAASPSMHRGFEDEYGETTVLTPPSSRDTNSAPIWSPRRAQRYTPIDGLGDATKSELRALTRVLDSLANKLEDTDGAHIPLVVEPTVDGWNDQSRDAEPQTPGKGGMIALESSVSAAYRLAKTLLDGMREELQLLREVEFEVVAGEKIWVDEMLKGMEDP